MAELVDAWMNGGHERSFNDLSDMIILTVAHYWMITGLVFQQDQTSTDIFMKIVTGSNPVPITSPVATEGITNAGGKMQ